MTSLTSLQGWALHIRLAN